MINDEEVENVRASVTLYFKNGIQKTLFVKSEGGPALFEDSMTRSIMRLEEEQPDLSEADLSRIVFDIRID